MKQSLRWGMTLFVLLSSTLVLRDAAGLNLPPQTDSSYTPLPGSPDRKAILSALRAEMRRFDSKPLVFVVRHLRIQRGWAWLEVDPQSPNGRSRYEREAALLHKKATEWQVVERMPAFGEREAEAREDCAYFTQLRKRIPGLPVRILPAAAQAPCGRRPRA